MGFEQEPEPGDDQALAATLLNGARAGDARAAAELDRLYRNRLLSFCWRYLGTPEEAEDATQEVLLRMLGSQEVPHRFRAWAYRIARNHCLNVLRRRPPRARTLPPPSLLDARMTGHLTRLVRNEQHSRIRHALDALPPAQQEALALRYADDLSRAEVAYVLDVPLSTVKSRLCQGLKNLRRS